MTLAQRIEILDWHHANVEKNQTKTAAYWDEYYPNLQLKQPTISAWLKNKDKWRAQFAEMESKGQAGRMKRMKQTEHPGVNEMLELWVTKAMADGIHINGEALVTNGHSLQIWMAFRTTSG